MLMEVWKDIPPYVGYYQASSNGRIRRINPRYGNGILAQVPVKTYLHAHLCVNAKRKLEKVHRLVAMAFHRLPVDGEQVNHKDGNKQNNIPDNIEWVTCRRNIEHAIETGLHDSPVGETNNNAKLSEHDVLDMRWLNKLGVGYHELAEEYQVKVLAVYRAVTGRSWSHI